jgi:hypothetical protein
LGLFEGLPAECFLGVRTQKLACSLWQLVRYQAQIVETQMHVLCFRRSQRRQFLKPLSFAQLLEQLEILESLFRVGLEVSRELRGREKEGFGEELFGVELLQFLALTLAHKFVSFYACALLCFQELAGGLMEQEDWALARLQKYCGKFQSNSFELIRFLKAFRRARGFEEFNYEEFNPFHAANLPLAIAAVLKDRQDRSCPLKRECSYRPSAMHVEPTLFGDVEIRKRRLSPRLQCPSPS